MRDRYIHAAKVTVVTLLTLLSIKVYFARGSIMPGGEILLVPFAVVIYMAAKHIISDIKKYREL